MDFFGCNFYEKKEILLWTVLKLKEEKAKSGWYYSLNKLKPGGDRDFQPCPVECRREERICSKHFITFYNRYVIFYWSIINYKQ